MVKKEIPIIPAWQICLLFSLKNLFSIISDKGKIKKNYDIHHIDHNKANNNINNLELYSKTEHASKFATGNNQYGKGNRQT